MVDELLRLVGVVLGLIVSAAGIVKVWRDARVASDQTHLSALEAAADEWRELKSEYADRLRATEEKAAALTETVDELRRGHRQLSARLDAVEADADVLSDALWEQATWIEAGAIPPPPTITAAALRAMHERRARRAEARPDTKE